MIKWRTHQSNVVWLGQASNDWPCKIGWFMAKNCRTFLTHWIRYLGMWLTIYQRNISCWFDGHTTPNFSIPDLFFEKFDRKTPICRNPKHGFSCTKIPRINPATSIFSKKTSLRSWTNWRGWWQKENSGEVSLLGHFFLHAWSCWCL